MSIATPTREFCNCQALDRGLDPIGHARTFDDAIVIETPLPWKADMMQSAGALPQEMIDLLALWLKAYYAGQGYPHLPLIIAPDAQYSVEGFRRVMLFTRPSGPFAQFERLEYLVPVDQLGPLLWSLYEARAALPGFEPYRVHTPASTRDILVCTHGTIDAACAKFGYPVYKFMRDSCVDELVRVWRVSHFGGHVFAPTLMDMPTGHYWAYVGQPQAAQIIARSGDVADLRGHYRGWAGVGDGFQQAAEAHLWQQVGWSWFDMLKSGTTVLQEADTDKPSWADVTLAYAMPGEEPATSGMRVEISHTIDTPHSTGELSTHSYAQYRVDAVAHAAV